MSLLYTCRYYSNKVRKSPHVVGHYAAGARLIGLTEKQMAKHWATLNITGDKNADSPYAQPVCLFIPGAFPKYLHGRPKNNGKIRLTIVKKGPKESKEGQELMGEDGGTIQNLSTQVQSPKLFVHCDGCMCETTSVVIGVHFATPECRRD